MFVYDWNLNIRNKNFTQNWSYIYLIFHVKPETCNRNLWTLENKYLKTDENVLTLNSMLIQRITDGYRTDLSKHVKRF
jgi:hypothetical protein